MTENLLQKLEEKMMLLLSELEDSRKEIQRLSNENAAFIAEKETHARKLQDLVSLLDAINLTEALPVNPILQAVKPILVQA